MIGSDFPHFSRLHLGLWRLTVTDDNLSTVPDTWISDFYAAIAAVASVTIFTKFVVHRSRRNKREDACWAHWVRGGPPRHLSCCKRRRDGAMRSGAYRSVRTLHARNEGSGRTRMRLADPDCRRSSRRLWAPTCPVNPRICRWGRRGISSGRPQPINQPDQRGHAIGHYLTRRLSVRFTSFDRKMPARHHPFSA
jgi:hypothetical protein